MASIFDRAPDPTPDEILARRIEIHRKRGEHDEADSIAKSGGADSRPRGMLSSVRNQSRIGRHLLGLQRKQLAF